VIVREIECKSILTKSGIEGVDYALNPYVGCGHGCVYCYASFMKRFTGHKEEWGAFVDVKVNAADVLARQMKRAKRGNIVSGTVTDPYQPLEERYEITRVCLKVLADYDSPVSILTKSNLVLRDLDLLRRLKDVEVGLTITALDDEVHHRGQHEAQRRDLGEGQESAGEALPRPGGGIPPYRCQPQALSRGTDGQSAGARREAWSGLGRVR
jgi:DNA repair photolyase